MTIVIGSNAGAGLRFPREVISSHRSRVLIFLRRPLKSKNHRTRSNAQGARPCTRPDLVIRSGLANNVIIVCRWRKTCRSDRFMTAFSSAASIPRKRPRAASSFPTPPRKSRRKARSSPSVPAPATMPARFRRSTSRSAIASCSASGPARRSRSTAKSC
ncbi:hypothetical protein RHECNPAF_730024 [Rhizobium etli CNPAF512]|nr:hypothetical protein RHECNPAF_730024 [Rhizobium etli CNPAF512]